MAELRTVRANCTQSERPIDSISTQTAIWSRISGGVNPRATPNISMAMRMEGKVSWISAMRMMTASTQPPKYPAISPRDTPMKEASRTAIRPMNRDNRMP